jgi:cytochrome oxidase Cu insertion factor (SCO1/SenC/PrrC family)
MNITRLFVLTVLSVAVLLLAACGGGGRQSGTPPEGDGSGGQNASGTGTEQASSGGEDFSVTTLEGERFDLSGGRGEVVALYFMAGW